MPKTSTHTASLSKAQLLLTSSMALAFVSGYGRVAYGGSCAPIGGGTYQCSGAASPGDATITLNSGAAPLTVTTQPGFGQTVSTGLGFNLRSTDSISFTDNNSSTISGSSIGIYSRNTGTGATSITVTGVVTGVGNTAIYSQNGATSTDLTILAVDVNGAVTGISGRNTGTGALTITSTGTVSGTSQDGINARNSGTDLTITAAAVSGGRTAIFAGNTGSGSISVTTSGAVTGGTGAGIATQGNAGAAVQINLSSGSTVSATSGTAITNDDSNATVSVKSGAAVNGAISLGDGSDLLDFSGGDFSGVTLFDGGDDNSSGDGFVDTLRFGSSGSLNGANVRNFEKFEVVNNAVVTLTDNTLTAGDGGAGTGIFTQSGGVLRLNSGATSLNGNVSNGGTISAQNGSVGDMITVSGDFIGNGGTVMLDVQLGGDGSTTDILQIGGDTSGTTFVSVNNIGGAGAQTINGIEIIQVSGTSGGSFTLNGTAQTSSGEQIVVAGPFGYRLVKTGSGNFALSSLDASGNPILVGAGAAAFETLPSVLLSMNRLRGYQARTASRLPAGPSDGGTVTRLTAPYGSGGDVLAYPNSPVWIELSGKRSDLTPVSSEAGITSVKTNTYTISVGVDTILSELSNGTLYGGVGLIYGDASSTVRTDQGTSNIDTESLGLNLSATWLDARGFYLDTQLQYNNNSSDVTDPTTGLAQDDIDSDQFAVSLEVGRPIEVNPGLVLVPQAQLSYTTLDVDEFTDSSGNQVLFEDAESVLARVGLSANKWFSSSHGAGSYFGLINLYHEFDPDTRVSVGGMDFDEEIDDTGIELGFGARMILNDRYELSGSLNYLTGLEDFGESYELEAVLGLQVRF